MSLTRVTLIFVVFYISGVFSVSEIYYTQFVNKNYNRICTTAKASYNPTNLCRKLAKQSYVKGAYPNTNNITGQCDNVLVKVYDDRDEAPKKNNPITWPFDIVLCQIGTDYKKCISASEADNVVEHFDYSLSSDNATWRCTRTGNMAK